MYVSICHILVLYTYIHTYIKEFYEKLGILLRKHVSHREENEWLSEFTNSLLRKLICSKRKYFWLKTRYICGTYTRFSSYMCVEFILRLKYWGWKSRAHADAVYTQLISQISTKKRYSIRAPHISSYNIYFDVFIKKIIFLITRNFPFIIIFICKIRLSFNGNHIRSWADWIRVQLHVMVISKNSGFLPSCPSAYKVR